MPQPRKTIVTITGPTCSGKTHLMRYLLATQQFAECVSHTTRPMRAGEEHEVDYYFVPESLFVQLEKMGHFIETISFPGNNKRYGMSAFEVDRVMKLGKTPALIVEPNGAKQIAAWCSANRIRHISIFIDAPVSLLTERYVARIRADDKTPAAMHVERLQHMLGAEREWLYECEWDLVVMPAATAQATDLTPYVMRYLQQSLRRPEYGVRTTEVIHQQSVEQLELAVSNG